MTNAMKKNYTKPVIEILTTETEQLLSDSVTLFFDNENDDNLVTDEDDTDFPCSHRPADGGLRFEGYREGD